MGSLVLELVKILIAFVGVFGILIFVFALAADVVGFIDYKKSETIRGTVVRCSDYSNWITRSSEYVVEYKYNNKVRRDEVLTHRNNLVASDTLDVHIRDIGDGRFIIVSDVYRLAIFKWLGVVIIIVGLVVIILKFMDIGG